MDPKTPKAENNEPRTETSDRAKMAEMHEEARVRRIAYLSSIDPSLPDSVERWKTEHPRVESIHILGNLYIYRTLLRSEYLATMGAGLDKNKNDEKIASRCLLWPAISELDWIRLPAGIPMTIADLVLAASGFGTEDAVPVRL